MKLSIKQIAQIISLVTIVVLVAASKLEKNKIPVRCLYVGIGKDECQLYTNYKNIPNVPVLNKQGRPIACKCVNE